MEISTIQKLLTAFERSLFVMIIAAALFVSQSFENYQSTATGIKVFSKKVDSYRAPTVMICFQPNKKPTLLQGYDIQNYSFFPPEVSKNNTTWPLVYQEISFKIGRDFNLTIDLDHHALHNSRDQVYTINNMSLSENTSKSIEFEEIISVNAGICYRVTPKHKMTKSQLNQIHIQFDESLPFDDIPKMIQVIFTSKENSYGILATFWKEGKELRFLIDSEKRAYNMAKLQLSEHKKLDGSNGCNNDDFYWNCISKKYT